jgi:gluconolactonase
MEGRVMPQLADLQLLISGLDHPEAVAWGTDGSIYAGGEAGQIYRIELDGQRSECLATTGGYVLGMAHDAEGNVYVCDMGRAAVLRVAPSGETKVYARGPADNPLRIPNFPVFDAAGRLYVSDSRDWRRNNGLLYVIYPEGSTEVWSHMAPGYTNGLVLAPDGSSIYVVESSEAQITEIAIRPDGTAGNVRAVLHLPGTVPDGLAFDVAGNLYISCYAPDRIYRSDLRGHLEVFLDDPLRELLNAPCNIAFAGPMLDRLVISSLGGRNLYWCQTDVPGQPLHYPRLA